MEENTNLDNSDFAWQPSPELIEQIQKAGEGLRQIYAVVVEWVRDLIERIREVADQLARFFLLQQLIEWRVPYPIANLVSKKVERYWAQRLGWLWFRNKLLE